jgi:molecular chaperone DnaK (HSP70)
MPDRVVRHNPWNLGIEIDDGAFIPIVGGDWRNPARGSLIFTTVADNQTRVEIHVLRGASDRAADNQSLAKLELTGITPAPKGAVQIEVTIENDFMSGISVSAQELPNGPRRSVFYKFGGLLNQADIQRLVEEIAERERLTRKAKKPEHSEED